VVLSTLIFSVGFLVYYWASYIAGDNLFKEFVVLYKQVETVGEKEIAGRTVEQRSYAVEAQPQTSRWRLILPPLLLNNLLIGIVLSVFAIWYSHRIAGPVYRITTDVRAALRGKRGVRIRLRRRDELLELANQINQLLEELDALDDGVEADDNATGDDEPPIP